MITGNQAERRGGDRRPGVRPPGRPGPARQAKASAPQARRGGGAGGGRRQAAGDFVLETLKSPRESRRARQRRRVMMKTWTLPPAFTTSPASITENKQMFIIFRGYRTSRLSRGGLARAGEAAKYYIAIRSNLQNPRRGWRVVPQLPRAAVGPPHHRLSAGESTMTWRAWW